MSNSSLVKSKILSPNHSGKRTHSIDRISIHCIVGQMTMDGLGYLFKNPYYGASCNYGVCTDGIVLIVEEKNRSWCTSSNSNDQRAITIETASDTTHPYRVRDDVYKNLLNLVYDICKRNGKDTLLWFGNKEKTLNYKPKKNEMVLTVHRWFDNKSCPGSYLYNRHGEIARITTERLQADKKAKNKKKKIKKIKVGDLVKITGNKWYGGETIPSWVKNQCWYVHSVSGNRAVINKNKEGTNTIMSPIDVKYLRKV